MISDPKNVARYMAPPADTPYPLEYAFHLLGDLQGKTVLDLGCGSAENSILLAFRGARVFGLDISWDLIAIAKKRLALNRHQADFVVSSVEKMALPNDSVDGVLGNAILHHVDLQLAAGEVWRVLKPGGYAVFGEPVRDSAAVRFIRRLIPLKAPNVSPYEYPLTENQITEFAARFTLCEFKPFALPHTRLALLLNRGIRKAFLLDRWLLRRFPSFRKFATVRIFRVHKPASSVQAT